MIFSSKAPQRNCYSDRLFHPCHYEPIGACQYCGRVFCAQHGDIQDDGQQICHRRTCQSKVADLKAHNGYVRMVSVRNEHQVCGIVSCGRQLWGACSGCEGIFCQSHVHPRWRTMFRNGMKSQEPVSMCDHCWRRHELWVQI